ncbi:hypothetical protein SAMN02982929_05321 [Saccharopolyspora kobensis]|uniref:Uncharacterized protein n=1 Tax=Saccharopolyspora kobensis TaxID=146035 RepID=A0A1H6E040_9PSEU|nr:hypothetical protein [Saccharopolyspora kobensis]SEG90831.1 hypothetical protein SAMN02982929_05321 [Saccharopolyspora kobensis]SFD94102.1 hypothetical protein SAMN05216506_107297 [Saccharopolyspora kobensis]
MTAHRVADARTTRALHDDIRDAAAELADPARRLLLRDDGSTTAHRAAPLLDQLAAARQHGATRSGTRRGPATAPVALEVVDLLARIEVESSAWCRYLTEQVPPADLRQRVHTIARAAGALTELDDLVPIHRFLSDWVRSILAVLDPPRRLHLAAACPVCEVRTVYRTDPTTGEAVLQPALWVDGTTGCTCLSCGHQWPTTHLEHLAAVLGCEPLDASATHQSGH